MSPNVSCNVGEIFVAVSVKRMTLANIFNNMTVTTLPVLASHAVSEQRGRWPDETPLAKCTSQHRERCTRSREGTADCSHTKHPFISTIAQRLTELRFYVPLHAKLVISETFFPASLLAKY